MSYNYYYLYYNDVSLLNKQKKKAVKASAGNIVQAGGSCPSVLAGGRKKASVGPRGEKFAARPETGKFYRIRASGAINPAATAPALRRRRWPRVAIV